MGSGRISDESVRALPFVSIDYSHNLLQETSLREPLTMGVLLITDTLDLRSVPPRTVLLPTALDLWPRIKIGSLPPGDHNYIPQL